MDQNPPPPMPPPPGGMPPPPPPGGMQPPPPPGGMQPPPPPGGMQPPPPPGGMQPPPPPGGMQPPPPPGGFQPPPPAGFGGPPPQGYAPQPGFQAPPGGYPVGGTGAKNPVISLVLSLVVPGLGTIINGEVGKGIGIMVGFFVACLLIFVLIGLLAAPLVWGYGLYDAYKGAQKYNLSHGYPAAGV